MLGPQHFSALLIQSQKLLCSASSAALSALGLQLCLYYSDSQMNVKRFTNSSARHSFADRFLCICASQHAFVDFETFLASRHAHKSTDRWTPPAVCRRPIIACSHYNQSRFAYLSTLAQIGIIRSIRRGTVQDI